MREAHGAQCGAREEQRANAKASSLLREGTRTKAVPSEEGREGRKQPVWGRRAGVCVRGDPQAELRAPPCADIKVEMFSFCSMPRSAGPAWGAD